MQGRGREQQLRFFGIGKFEVLVLEGISVLYLLKVEGLNVTDVFLFLLLLAQPPLLLFFLFYLSQSSYTFSCSWFISFCRRSFYRKFSLRLSAQSTNEVKGCSEYEFQGQAEFLLSDDGEASMSCRLSLEYCFSRFSFISREILRVSSSLLASSSIINRSSSSSQRLWVSSSCLRRIYWSASSTYFRFSSLSLTFRFLVAQRCAFSTEDMISAHFALAEFMPMFYYFYQPEQLFYFSFYWVRWKYTWPLTLGQSCRIITS